MTKKQLLKELEMILGNVNKAYSRSENLAKKIDVPSLCELYLIKTQLEDVIKLGKESIK